MWALLQRQNRKQELLSSLGLTQDSALQEYSSQEEHEEYSENSDAEMVMPATSTIQSDKSHNPMNNIFAMFASNSRRSLGTTSILLVTGSDLTNPAVEAVQSFSAAANDPADVPASE
eukprot:g32361.t1